MYIEEIEDNICFLCAVEINLNLCTLYQEQLTGYFPLQNNAN